MVIIPGQKPLDSVSPDTDLSRIAERLFRFQNDWHYNSYTAHYFWWKKRHRAIQIFSRFLKNCVKPSVRILDLGCGDGYDLFLLAKQAAYLKKLTGTDARFFGIDIDRDRIGYAAKRVLHEAYSDIIRVYQGNVQGPLEEFLPASFDFILCSEVIEHLPEPEKAILNISKLLVPGGWAVVTTPNPGNVISRISGWLGLSNKQDASSQHDYGDISAKNYRDWIGLFRETGFKIVKIYRGPLIYGNTKLDQAAVLSGLLIALDGLIDILFPYPDLAFSSIFLLKKKA